MEQNVKHDNPARTMDIEESIAQKGKAPSSKKKAPGAFLTISEVADELQVQQHVLRFWETKFSQVRPLKRGGGRRYYRPEDVTLLKRIHELLYSEGYTIKGVQKLLREQGKNKVLKQGAQNEVQREAANEALAPVSAAVDNTTPSSSVHKEALEVMLDELKALRELLKNP